MEGLNLSGCILLKPREYEQSVARLRREYIADLLTEGGRTVSGSAQNYMNALEFASANLRHLLPEVSLKQRQAVLAEALFSKACAELDESNGFVLDSAIVHDPGGWLTAACERPVIFCSFHYGSYRLINYLLARADLKFIVLTSRDIWESKRTRFLEYHKEAQAYFSKAGTRMEVVNVEAPTTVLALTRKVRTGWSLLAYLDGDNGVLGSGRHDSKVLRTSLLGQPLFARKGVAFLAHFLQIPIVPVVCKRTGLIERDITVHEPIYPSDKTSSRDAFCRSATNALYALLGKYLSAEPGQWERWFDIQTALDTDAISENSPVDEVVTVSPESISQVRLKFNHERFGFVMHAGRRALLDKFTYRLLSLPSRVTAILEAYREPGRVPPVGLPVEEHDILRELVERRMLEVVP